MSSDRNIITIIQSMINQIPTNESYDLLNELTKLLIEINWTAPEIIYIRWNEMNFIINKHLKDVSDTSPQYKKNIINILCDKIIFN